MFESKLEFLAITGLGDKLQFDVPRAIQEFKRADMKIWILTGDKFENTKRISNLSGLTDQMCISFTILKLTSFEAVQSKLELAKQFRHKGADLFGIDG